MSKYVRTCINHILNLLCSSIILISEQIAYPDKRHAVPMWPANRGLTVFLDIGGPRRKLCNPKQRKYQESYIFLINLIFINLHMNIYTTHINQTHNEGIIYPTHEIFVSLYYLVVVYIHSKEWDG